MAAAASTSSLSKGASGGGRYRLFAPIGAGGMGTVYIGRLQSSANFARTVAIKRPLPELARDAEFRESIRREARVAARVHHPNVVATLDVIEVEGELWVVMEYVHGPTLAALSALARERDLPIPLDVALALVEGILRGLEAVHSARDEGGAPLGVVHRDLSPHNVLCGLDGLARVADFGLARAEAMTSITHTARFKGKLAYASPEQAESLPLTPASDLYSSGVILWELLTGQRLYPGATATEVVARLLTAAVPAPSTLRTSVPAALDAVVLRALERDPKRRYATAAEMLDALKSARAAASVDAVARWLREIAGGWVAEREQLLSAAERGAGGRALEQRALDRTGERDPPRVLPSRERAIGLRAILRGAGLATGVSLVWFGADFMLDPARNAPEAAVATGPVRGAEAPGDAPAIFRAGALPNEASMKRTGDATSRAGAAPRHRRPAFDAGVAASSAEAARSGADPEVAAAAPRAAARRAAAGAGISGAGSAPRTNEVAGAAAPAGTLAGNTPRPAPGASSPAATAPRPRSASGGADCDPPYLVDAEGIRHMRPGCQ